MRDGNTDSADPNMSSGERIKFFRTRRGMSREALAGLAGRTPRWLRAVESGQIKNVRLADLALIAEALRIKDVGRLAGAGVVLPVEALKGPGHPALPAVRDAINALASTSSVPPVALDALQARLDAAWRARHASPDHRTVLGALLPDLIRDARYAVRVYDGPDRRRAQALLAGVYNLSQFYVAYQPTPDLLWRVVERSMMAAEESEDPHAVGGAVWLAAQAHRDAGDFDAAEQINRQGLELLEPHVDDENVPVRAIFGALQYEAAYTAARAGERGQAWHWWEKADRTARTLPSSYYDPMTSFSRVIMSAHAVTTAVELRQGGEAVRQANAAAGIVIPSQPRRGRHLIEVARAYELAADQRSELGTLKDAYVTAPETIRFNSYARRMVLGLTEGPGGLRPDARDLAERIGMAV
jgi:transcriptional regulator with XRE-family HTH domain